MSDPHASCPALVGPTAVGKTGLVLRLAEEFPLEVISLDSRQIYQGLRIGTAQPTAEERAVCPHHLVDFLSPEQRYSARRFRDDFVRVHAGIVSRGSVPLLVGGTGMYLQVLQEGLMPIPDDGPDLETVRAELEALSDLDIRARLAAVDPESFARIAAGDRYRSQRALEIQKLSGRTMSELRAEQRPDPAAGLEFPVVLLHRERDVLRARIARRTDAMLASGWIEETRANLDLYGPEAPGMATLGYREIVRHLNGQTTLPETRDEIVLRTCQYAKRQRTWFRPRPRTAEGAPDAAGVIEALRRLLHEAAPS